MEQSRNIANPFPGLRPFETDEYRLFFGREGQSDELLERLARTRFLAVIGTSGSGKSSLVRAGLLPAMRGGLMAGAGSGWRIAVMRPGHDPIGNLACAFADKDVLPEAGGGLEGAEAEAVIEATLRRGSLGLVDAARQARLSSYGNLLVVVDQFEELFRFRAARAGTSTGDDAAAFVKLLLEAARQRELPIYVVLTMRSDFLGDCAQFQGLPEAINDGQYLIPRMTRDERRVAITGPVAVARGRLAEPLVNRLLNDVGDNPDQLPILQHALMRTWDFWKQNRLDGEPIGVGHYEAIGTMSDALSRHADEAFNELDERQQKIAERMFKALTEKGADNREIRRPARLAEVCAIVEATHEEVVAVVEVFRREGRSFLMPPVGVQLDPDTVIDISHESLIRNWGRLRDWVDEEAESAHMYRRLAYAAEAGSYISGAFLDTALDWRNQNRPTAAWAERYHAGIGLSITFEQVASFLDASMAHRDALVAEEEKRRQEEIERKRRELEQAQAFAKQQQRAKRRLFWLAAAMFLMVIVAGISWLSAKRAKDKAENMQSAGTTYREALASLKIGKVDKARQQFESSAAQFEKLGDIGGAVASYMDLGDTYFDKSLGEIGWEKGAAQYARANELYQRNKDVAGQESVLHAMGNTFMSAARAVLDEGGDDEKARATARRLLDKGQEALERASKLYQNKGDLESNFLVLNQLATSVSDERFWPDNPKEGYEKAVKYYEEALNIYRQQSASSELKGKMLSKYQEMALKLADIVEGKFKNREAARRYRDMAIEAIHQSNDTQAEADMLLDIARSFGPEDRQYKEYRDKAVKIFKDSEDLVGEAKILEKIADRRLMSYLEISPRGGYIRDGPGMKFEIIKKLKPPTRMLILADDGTWFKGRVMDKEEPIEGFIHHDVSRVARDDTSLNSTLEDYQTALDIYTAKNMLKEQGDLLRKMADVDIGAKSGGDDKRALKYLNQGLEVYKKLGDTQAQRQVLDKIATINERLKQFPAALSARKAIVDLSSDDEGRVNALIALGDLQARVEQFKDALASYEQARRILKQPNAQLETRINDVKKRLQATSQADVSSSGDNPQL